MLGILRRITAACALLLAACGGVKTTVSTGCSTNAECPAGEACDPHGLCICTADAGCASDGGASDASTAATLTTINVTPAGLTLPVGTMQQFTATGVYSDGSMQDLTATVAWSTSNSAIATVNLPGLVQAVSQGTTNVTATDGALNGVVQVVVGAAVIEKLTIAPANPSLAVGDTVQLAATATYSDMSMQTVTSTVTWNSGNGGVASVSTGGLVTAVQVGTASVTATDGSLTAVAGITVTSAALVSISIAPMNPTVTDGQTLSLAATGLYSDGSMMDLTTSAIWAIEMPAVPPVATIAAGGALTTLMPGVVTVSATYGNAVAPGTTQVTVLAATLVSISVTPADPSVAAGDSIALTATGKYTDGSLHPLTSMVTWSTLQPTVATVDAAGELHALSPGSTGILAELGTMQTMEGSTSVTVTPAQLSSVAITPANATLSVGTSAQLTATGTFTDGSTEPVNTGATWTSSNPAVATISATGSVHAVSIGTITVTVLVDGISSTTQLTVGTATIVSLTIAPLNSTVPLGATSSMGATGKFSDGSTHDVTAMTSWQSSIPSVASISASGLVTAESLGTVTITGTDGAFMASTSLTVGAPVLASIVVGPSGQSIAQGTTIQLTATGTLTDGSTQNETQSAVWSSSANGVLSVTTGTTQNGIATGEFQGTGSATATVGSISGTVEVTVTKPALESLAIAPSGATIPQGETAALAAIGTFTYGMPQDLTATATWSSSAPAIAAVAAPGSIVGKTAGMAVITAQYGSFTATAMISVSALNTISVTPNGSMIPAGGTQQLDAVGNFANGAMVDLTSTVIWSSDTPTVATVNAAGLVTGLMPGGPVTITATDGSITGTVVLSVVQPALVSIAVGPTSIGVPVECTDGLPTLDLPETEQMSAEGTYTDGSTADLSTQVTWGTSDATIATISASGLAQGIGVGTVTLTAVLDGITGDYALAVLGPTGITIIGGAQPVPAGTTATLVASGTYADGSTLPATLEATWTTTDSTVIAIAGPGLVNATGTSGEVATITATLNGVSGSAAVTVSSPTLVSIAVTPADQTIPVGGQVSLHATGTYTDGSTKNLTNSAAWSSTAVALATVDNGGNVTSISGSTGDPQIIATVGTIFGLTNVTIQ